jgi:hypothetical protein
MIIAGKKLMVFLDGKSIAYATSHSVDLSSSTSEVAHKDIQNWGVENVTMSTSWTMSSDSLFAFEGAGNTIQTLLNAWQNGTKVDVVFALSGTFNSSTGWTIDTSETTLSGEGVITSLNISADTSDNATYSVTITGSGDLTIS